MNQTMFLNQASNSKQTDNFINLIHYKTISHKDEGVSAESVMSLDTDHTKEFNNESFLNSCEKNSTEQLYSGYFGGRGDDIKNVNNTTINPFPESGYIMNQGDQKANFQANLNNSFQNQQHQIHFESSINTQNQLNNSLQHNHQRNFSDLMKKINLSNFQSHSYLNEKPKKKILTSEEILLEKIQKEKENIRMLKLRNEQSVEKIKNSAPKNAFQPSPLTLFQPFNITQSGLLNKKRGMRNTEEANEKIKEQMKKKLFEGARKEKIINKKENNEDLEDEEDLSNISLVMENFSLKKGKNEERINIGFKYGINSQNQTKNINSNIKSIILNTSDKKTVIANTIMKTRKEKENIDRENRELNKKMNIRKNNFNKENHKILGNLAKFA